MDVKQFGDTAKGLARNPLHIIALFIVLIYGFASLVVGLSGQLETSERLPLVWFLVVIPVLVLGVFTYLVGFHHTHLYAPSDFEQDDAFLRAARRNEVRAGILLGAASATAGQRRAMGNGVTESVHVDTDSLADLVVSASDKHLDAVSKTRVLWVDDEPQRNEYERQALEALGIKVDVATSAQEALQWLRGQAYDAIVSGMTHADDERTREVLLDILSGQGSHAMDTPCIIYGDAEAPEQAAVGKEHGAYAVTSSPDDLVKMVVSAVDQPRLERRHVAVN